MTAGIRFLVTRSHCPFSNHFFSLSIFFWSNSRGSLRGKCSTSSPMRAVPLYFAWPSLASLSSRSVNLDCGIWRISVPSGDNVDDIFTWAEGRAKKDGGSHFCYRSCHPKSAALLIKLTQSKTLPSPYVGFPQPRRDGCFLIPTLFSCSFCLVFSPRSTLIDIYPLISEPPSPFIISI